MGALNSWNTKGTMYIATPGVFAAGTHGMQYGGAALMVIFNASLAQLLLHAPGRHSSACISVSMCLPVSYTDFV